MVPVDNGKGTLLFFVTGDATSGSLWILLDNIYDLRGAWIELPALGVLSTSEISLNLVIGRCAFHSPRFWGADHPMNYAIEGFSSPKPPREKLTTIPAKISSLKYLKIPFRSIYLYIVRPLQISCLVMWNKHKKKKKNINPD